MISRILKSTQGKPCSCPTGKICEGCKKKKTVKPQVYLEEPHRLTVPIVIQRHRPPTTTVQIIDKPKRWSIRKKESPVKQATFCAWYKKRKAFNELKREYQREKRREKEERLERARRKREIEVLEQLEAISRLQAETATKRAETLVAKKESPVVVKKPRVKEKRVKTRTTAAKPRADSKYVSVKRYNRYDSLSTRFVNCCYRICCQFYCYMSFIFIIGFVIIYFL